MRNKFLRIFLHNFFVQKMRRHNPSRSSTHVELTCQKIVYAKIFYAKKTFFTRNFFLSTKYFFALQKNGIKLLGRKLKLFQNLDSSNRYIFLHKNFYIFTPKGLPFYTSFDFFSTRKFQFFYTKYFFTAKFLLFYTKFLNFEKMV